MEGTQMAIRGSRGVLENMIKVGRREKFLAKLDTGKIG